MTVRELIDLLAEYDPHTNVAVASDEEWNVVRSVTDVDPELFLVHEKTTELEPISEQEDYDGATPFVVIW